MADPSVLSKPSGQEGFSLSDQQLRRFSFLYENTGLTNEQIKQFSISAFNAVEIWCNRKFLLNAYKKTFRCYPLNPSVKTLILDHYPIQSLENVFFGDETVNTDVIDYDPDSPCLYIKNRSGHFIEWPRRTIYVEYTAGFVSENLPENLLQAIITLACTHYAQSGRDPLLKSESVAGVGSTSWIVPDATTGGMPPSVAALLEPYRRIGIA